MSRLQDYYKEYPEKREHLDKVLSNSKKIQCERDKKAEERLRLLERMKEIYYGKRA